MTKCTKIQTKNITTKFMTKQYKKKTNKHDRYQRITTTNSKTPDSEQSPIDCGRIALNPAKQKTKKQTGTYNIKMY